MGTPNQAFRDAAMTTSEKRQAEPTANVLLVDDRPEELRALEDLLRPLRPRVVKARSAEEALQRLARDDFAVLLLGVQMEGADGFETAKQIRRGEGPRHTPIIFLADAESPDFPLVKAYELGAVDYLVKPLVPVILRAKVAGFVELFRKTEQVRLQAERLREMERTEFERRLAEEEQSWMLAYEQQAHAEAERQREFVRLVLEHVPQAVTVSQGPEHRLLLVNPAAVALAGLAPEEVLGRTADEVVPESTEVVRATLDRVYQAGATETIPDLTVRRRDGQTANLQMTYVPVPGPGGKPMGVIHVAVDLSERKRTEEELRRRAEQLAEADRRKNEFLAMLGHELRNPLAPIRNAVQLLRLRGNDPSTVAWAGQVADRQVTHLVRLVDDLLDVSRISRGKVRLQRGRLDLAEVVRATAEDHRGHLRDSGLTLELDVPPGPVWVHGDPTRLSQVLGNLLHNAAKFTDAGGRVAVRLAEEPELGRATVRVQDTGIGIEPEMLSRVFETFTQADRSMERSRGGLGLGLALVKGLVQLHGGEVEAFSAGPGQGAEFLFRLPLEQEAAAPAAAPARAGPNGHPRRVLIVEDNRDGADSLRLLLELMGHDVRVALNGSAGIQVAAEFRPEVVLCDLGLPGMNGFAVAAALRGEPATAGARLIAVSGYGQEEDRRRCQEAGFDLHLTKPVELDELVRVLGASADGERGAVSPPV